MISLSDCGLLLFAQFGLTLLIACIEVLENCTAVSDLDIKDFHSFTLPAMKLICFYFSGKGLSIMTFIKNSSKSSCVSILHIKASIWLLYAT